MRLLLDTNVFLWAANEPDRLGAARTTLADPRNSLLLSAVSSWEIAIKSGLGRLPLPEPAADWVPRQARTLGCTLLPIEHAHALAVDSLPPHHNDPFDRLLIAQAQQLQVPFVTSDRALRVYGIEIIHTGAK